MTWCQYCYFSRFAAKSSKFFSLSAVKISILRLSHLLPEFSKPLGSRKQIPDQILVPTVFRDENFYNFFITKFFTFFLTLYIGQHKDNQAPEMIG